MPALTWAQAVTVYVDRNPVQMDETLQLVVRFNGGNPNGSPDLSVLEKDFEVLGTSQSSRTSIINGKMESSTEWVSTLAPKREGTITIPPIPIGSDVSLPITVKVLPAGQPGEAGQARDVFLDVQVEPSDPYVQSQVHVTVKLYHAIPLREGRLDDPKADDLFVEKLGEDRSFETVVDGRRYGVIERHYAVFPQKSGAITIPPLNFAGQAPDNRRRRSSLDEFFGGRSRGFGNDPLDSLFQSSKPVRTRSKPVTLNVRPIPSNVVDDHWLPATGLELRESWAPEKLDQHELRVGEPITRTITVLAKGLTSAQLPELSLPQHAKVKIYPDLPVTETKVDGTTVLGMREQKLAFVPSEAGEIALPAIQIPWWDLKTNQRRVAHLPARTLKILPEPGLVQSSKPHGPTMVQAPTSGPTQEAAPESALGASQPIQRSLPWWWQAATGTLFLLWILTMGGWWYDRRNRRNQIHQKKAEADMATARSLKEAKKACEQACRSNDPKKAKETLLQWATQKWASHPPLGLTGIAQRLADSDAREAVWDLDRLLYSSTSDSWDGQLFWRRISGPMETTIEPESQTSDEVLPPLYLSRTSGS